MQALGDDPSIKGNDLEKAFASLKYSTESLIMSEFDRRSKLSKQLNLRIRLSIFLKKASNILRLYENVALRHDLRHGF
jgi:hypothetical protein